jgi:hypothetical protein
MRCDLGPIRVGIVLVMVVLALVVAPKVRGDARNQGVAMVLSVAGTATVTGADGTARKALPMAVLETGEVVTTAAGGSVVLVLFADSREYAVGESAKVELTAAGPKALAGSVKPAAKQDRLKLPANSSLSSRRLMGEMVRASQATSAHFLQPANFTQVVDGAVTLEWRLGTPAAKVVLLILGQDEEEVLRTEVTGSSFSYPPAGGKPLAEGTSFFAKVWDPAAPPGNAEARAETEFRVMTAAEAEQVRANEKAAAEESASDPANPAPLMKLMVFQLERRLLPEAVATGTKLEPLIPDNPNLYLYLARAYAGLGRLDEAAAASQKAWELQGR